ncbi:MAG: non-heme iron oxygenase ferredoxin subunit [Gammaproteobacteria bacterium]|nr:non-heme iron oxygenase ferredoxin subunit [Gammaproteobacteria bacterium]
MSEWVTVAGRDELQPGQQKTVDVDGVPVVVINLDGRHYAIEDICSHDGARLDGGCIEGEEIVCPRHGAHFSIKTGAALSAPAFEPIATFPVRIHAGVIQVKDDRWD